MKKLACLLFIWGVGFTCAHYWIHLKAEVAQRLIADAWQTTVINGSPQKPWQWADTWPVAKLSVPSRNIDHYVLATASGQSLAFGPGLLAGQEVIDGKNDGLVVISGHRDTHFRFLQTLNTDDTIELASPNGTIKHFRVTATSIKNSLTDTWYVDATKHELKLITCYPFDAINAGGPLRYIVTAEEIAPRTYSL